jgi:RHS repeat-associated protein
MRPFTGKERDAETELDFFGARYYSGAQGRFTSPDEFPGGIVDPFTGQQVGQPGPLPYADITDPQTLNKYAYVRNNPLRYTDPDGHCTDPLTCTAEGLEIGAAIAGPSGAIVGGALGAVTGYFLGTAVVKAGVPEKIVQVAGTMQDPDSTPWTQYWAKRIEQGQQQGTQQQSTPASPDPDRHGGGKTGQKQNVRAADSAKDKFDAAKTEYDQLKGKPNKTKEENQQLDTLRRQVDHWRKKAAEESEEHARTGQHS